VGPIRITSEELVERSVWTELSLGYARQHGRRKLARLLGAVKDDVELEGALVALPPGEHLGPTRDGSRERIAHDDALSTEGEDDARRRKREAEGVRDRLAAWRLFVEAEFRGLRLRQEGQLGKTLGEPMAGESSSALKRLAEEDQRQARSGMVALMSNGKTSYKRVEELREGDMPARAAAERLRITWLKERRDVWLARRPGARDAHSLAGGETATE
jgi:hypothetical protein